MKGAVYEAREKTELLVRMGLEGGERGGKLKIEDAQGRALLETGIEDVEGDEGLDKVFGWLREKGYLDGLAAVGHRLVHGGKKYRKPVRITDEVTRELEKLAPIDPDHLPAALRGIQYAAKQLGVEQVACFDTAFHQAMPRVAQMYALPRELYEKGILRFGFHGLSYEFLMQELGRLEGEAANGRVVLAHLGSGASMAAVRGGKSVDTSMGFTPLEGLVMSTRSGDIDAGAVLYLLEQGAKEAGDAGVGEGMKAEELAKLLNKKSGLRGVSGQSGDMRELLASEGANEAAHEAVNLFCYRAKKYLGGYAAALGGLDLLVFAGGIGEHAAEVRARICGGLDFLGMQLDEKRNASNEEVISSEGSKVKVRVIKTDEDWMIAKHVKEVMETAKQ